jgi:hypothetical protein
MQGRHLTTTRAMTPLLLGLALIGLAAGPARADLLADLIASNGTVQVGGLVFDQFSYSATGQMPPATSVNVAPIFDVGGNPGLRFSGGFTDASNGLNTTQFASDAVLSYRVTALGAPLSDIHLFGNPQILGPGDGVMSVTETLMAGTQPVQIEIHDTVNNGVASLKFQDSTTFPPIPSIQVVTKDIFAFNLGGFPTQSFVDQTFSRPVPEPGTFVLMGFGVAAMAGYRWSKARQRHRRPLATPDGN